MIFWISFHSRTQVPMRFSFFFLFKFAVSSPTIAQISLIQKQKAPKLPIEYLNISLRNSFLILHRFSFSLRLLGTFFLISFFFYRIIACRKKDYNHDNSSLSSLFFLSLSLFFYFLFYSRPSKNLFAISALYCCFSVSFFCHLISTCLLSAFQISEGCRCCFLHFFFCCCVFVSDDEEKKKSPKNLFSLLSNFTIIISLSRLQRHFISKISIFFKEFFQLFLIFPFTCLSEFFFQHKYLINFHVTL